MTKRIYIAGAGGMLGEAFHHVFGPDHELKCTDIDVNADWLSLLDFRDLDAYRADVEAFKPDYLFHLGAYTSLEYCEEHVADTYATNTLAVENAVHIANRLGIPLLYISTAGIFDGRQETYDDWDDPAPLGHYARSKYAGERFVVANADRYLVCRAGWMMGGGPTKDKKFVQKLMKQLKDGATELHVVDDKLGTPTYTRDFAANVKLLLERELWGVYNMVCGGVTGRFEVAQYLVQALGLTEKVAVTPVTSDYFAAEYFAARPPSERLLTVKLDLRGANVMRDWRVCLDEYLADKYVGYLDR
ncbi:sugar nucleotide-binding protein [Sphingomonas sp. CROZ-RG-20F-R02-07]|uniref:SDR family oxidoreductase n=1 Tax=Sphingomonas sp. CROZ-RG-20F-R02-07 TaxID=2914832 RepID=UPI001F586987|nr:sugar nucleotide-binding protein [Sphingomonas sp. CROZ-RG-20F-R02-07]